MNIIIELRVTPHLNVQMKRAFSRDSRFRAILEPEERACVRGVISRWTGWRKILAMSGTELQNSQ